jgi:putative ABC transport system substrate-binding protein
MKRREFIAGLGGAAVWPLAAGAQQTERMWRVGVLTPAETAATPIFTAFRKAIALLGYVEGRTIRLEFGFGKGDPAALPKLAAELVRLPVDVLVTDSMGAAIAAFGATRSLPIVMGTSVDPVEAGLVASIARPGGNVTGLTIRATDLAGKRMQLLKQAFPAIRHVIALANGSNPGTSPILRASEKVAATLGVHVSSLLVDSAKELHALGPDNLKGGDGIITFPDAMLWNNRAAIITLAASARVPAIYPEREFVEDGGLIAYGPSIPDAFRKAAGYVDRILKGAKPADLPVEEPSRFDFVVNVRRARELRLLPEGSFLIAADEVIE